MFNKNSSNSTNPNNEIGKSINPNFFALLHGSSTSEQQIRLFGAMQYHMQRTGNLNISVSDDSLDESLELFDESQKQSKLKK